MLSGYTETITLRRPAAAAHSAPYTGEATVAPVDESVDIEVVWVTGGGPNGLKYSKGPYRQEGTVQAFDAVALYQPTGSRSDVVLKDWVQADTIVDRDGELYQLLGVDESQFCTDAVAYLKRRDVQE